jgi:excisionase family DNA binding protein
MSETISAVRDAAAVADATLAAAAAVPTRRLLDVHDLAAMLGISWRTALRLADAGKMPRGLKLGALRRWDREEIEEWIARGCKPVRTAGKA